jgi:uncharacterized protein (TIGR02145 family)
MKTIVTLMMSCCLWISLFAQAPSKMSYQAVVRDAGGNLVTNKTIKMRITILEGALPGSMVYQEIQSPVTNDNGLVTLEIGGDIRFEIINWGNGTHYIKTEIDPTGGLNYTIVATSQLLSVPYAYYAKTAGTSPPWISFGSNIYYNNGNVGIGVTDPVFNLDIRGKNRDESGIIMLGNADVSHKMVFYGGRENDPNPFIQWKQGDPLRFSTDGGGWSEKMRIDTAGNVGIGTVNPAAKLDVSGEINVNAHRIRNVADPVNAQDAATKAYVDAMLKSLGLLPNNFAGVITDIEGNPYKTVRIGSQVWMAENLKTTKYNDGAAIPLVADATAWDNLTTPGYCWYDDNPTTIGAVYGALYNWHTVNTGKLCPSGWHVPTDAEWTTLENYLIANGYNYDGTTTGNKIAKSLATATSWTSSTNYGAVGNTDYPAYRNKSGFSTLPGGCRYYDGLFGTVGSDGYWWSSTETSADKAWDRGLYSHDTVVSRYDYYKDNGFSVRCLRD